MWIETEKLTVASEVQIVTCVKCFVTIEKSFLVYYMIWVKLKAEIRVGSVCRSEEGQLLGMSSLDTLCCCFVEHTLKISHPCMQLFNE